MSSHKIPRLCEFCGSAFLANPYKVSKGKGRFCSQKCGASGRQKKHGHTTSSTQSATYTTYYAMLARCYNENSPKYSMYGGKGIVVCDRWRESFQNFLDDMGERPVGTTIDRINGSLGYRPNNCRWASIAEQQSNLSSNINIEFMGKTLSASEWSRQTGIAQSLIAWRIRNGWSIDDALTIVPRRGNSMKKSRHVLIEHKGKTQCIAEWAREYGIPDSSLRIKLKRGLTIAEALGDQKVKSDHDAPS